MSEQPAKFRILLVEDDLPWATMLIEFWLKDQPDKYLFDVVHVTSLRQAEAQVADGGDFDVILLDLGLPDSTTTETIAKLPDLAKRWGDPIVVVTGSHDVECVVKGAADFIHKTTIALDSKGTIGRIAVAYANHQKHAKKA